MPEGNIVNMRPFLGFRGFKWFFKDDWFSMYKWEDPEAYSRSGRVLQRVIDVGAISIGIRYLRRARAVVPNESGAPGQLSA